VRLACLYPEHLAGGQARVLQSAATWRALAREGARVHLVVGRFRGLEERLAGLGLAGVPGLVPEPVAMCQPGPGSWAPFAWHGVYHAAAAARLRGLAGQGLDAVLVRHLKLARELLRRRPAGRAPVAYEAHELFAQTAAEEGLAPARLARLAAREREVLAGAEVVLAISRPLARALGQAAPLSRPPELAPSGADPAFLEVPQDRREPGLVAYAGGLGPWKGVELLLEAAARLPGARLEVLGGEPGSPDWRRVQARAAELGLGPRLALLPRAGQEEVRELLARAAVAVWPGTGRRRIAAEFTSPLKLFEYLAAGCPTVAPRVPAATSVVADGRQAALFSPDDPADLARVLGRLLAAPEEAAALGAAGRELARDYTWRARARRILAALERARGEAA
jgi:glycosyltransferase involved in cell wall biosynthesis